MEELSDNEVRAKLSDALAAVRRVREAIKERQPLRDVKEPLRKAIESFDTPPAPSPFPGDVVGGGGG